MTQPVIYSCSSRLVPSVCGARWVEGDGCPTSQGLPSSALLYGTVMCALSQADSWVKFTGGASCRRQPSLPESGGPGHWAGRAGIRGRGRGLCAASRTPKARMPPAVRWAARSAGWLWIFGAVLGQCLGYNSQQQRVAFLQPPDQNHQQAHYGEFKPNQVMSLLNFALGWGRVLSFVIF